MTSSNTSAQQKDDKHDDDNDHYRPDTDVHGLVPSPRARERRWLISELDLLAVMWPYLPPGPAGIWLPAKADPKRRHLGRGSSPESTWTRSTRTLMTV